MTLFCSALPDMTFAHPSSSYYTIDMWRPGSAIRKDDWKLVHFYEQDQVELFDLSKDLGEQNNLADSLPEMAASLKAALQESLAEMNAQMVENL